MIGSISGVDTMVFAACILLLLAAGIFSVRRNSSASGYFMAERNLPWWSVAGSIFATNVSLSQIIGMLGIGYSIGFAQSHYELLAVPAILLLANVFVPVYRKKQVFTLSEFLGERYNETARWLYTLIIIAVIIILLVGGLYIGSRQLGLLLSDTSFQPSYIQGILIIALLSCLMIFSGGMHAVVVAENIITVLMVIAVVTVGVCTLYQPEIGGFTGLMKLDGSEEGMNKMHLYLPSNHPDLPWTGVFSGLLVLHGFFWTTNQFEVQRVLAAKSDRDARIGAIVAGFLKLTIPFFSISAGVAAAYLFRLKFGMEEVVKPDDAFVFLLDQVVPKGYGLIGLILAGFIGAIFSSIYSMLNSLSTVVAMDLYKRYINREAADYLLVRTGRMAVIVACLAGAFLAWWSFDPSSGGNFFLTLSRNTSYLKPGIVSAFFLGVFAGRIHPASAAVAILMAPLLSFGLEWVYEFRLSSIPFFSENFGLQLNFLHRVFIVFILCTAIQLVMSKNYKAKDDSIYLSDPLIKFSFRLVLIFGLMNIFFVTMILQSGISSEWIALPAAVFTLLIYNGGFDFTDRVRVLGGLLSALTVWSLYRFV
jgi:SSS family solute:Na+ symporter